MHKLALWLVCVAALGCSARGAVPSSPVVTTARSYTWLEAACSDGKLELAQLGFERTLELLPIAQGFAITMESTLATRGCRSTELVVATRAREGGYTFAPKAHVTLPEGASCGAEESAPAHGTLRYRDGKLVVTQQRSAWCRGLDARFVYVPVDSQPLSPEQIARRFAAHFHAGDPAGLARLFARDGTLVEPFTKTDDGSDARHEGRGAIARYFSSAFGSVAWHALRVTSIDEPTANGELTLRIAYMDSALAEPLRVRIGMLAVGGELLQVEVQLEHDPHPREPASSSSAAYLP